MGSTSRKSLVNVSELEIAEDLARKSGMTLGEWLNHVAATINLVSGHTDATNVSDKSTHDESYGLPHDGVIGAGVFKAKCLGLLDAVAQTRKSLTITKNGKPIAQLTPIPPDGELFGALYGTVRFEDDIITPLENEWSAAR